MAEATAEGYGAGRSRLLVTAERLFGQLGINNVSLRQIVVAAEQGNHSAVALHFGDKAGLIQAILHERRPIIDAGRKQRFETLLAHTSNPSLHQLLECLMMPWVDDVDDVGNHPYACFVAQLMWAEEEYILLTMLNEAPIFQEILTRIRAIVHHLDEETFRFRLRMIFQLFLTSVLHKGRVPLSDSGQVGGMAVFHEIIVLATCIFNAPQSQGAKQD